MIRIDGKTRLLGILGNPVSHSLSPLIHNFSAAQLGINQVYVPFEAPYPQLNNFMSLMWDLGCVGFNVTTPYKEVVANLIPGAPGKSVNTVYRGSESWLGISTDGLGFARALNRLETPLAGFGKVVFLGCGGAVTAILEHITREFETCPEVVVLRRNPAMDAVVKGRLPDGFPLRILDFVPQNLQREISGRGGETLLVQATSAPLFGETLQMFADMMSSFHGVFVDLVYRTPSALLQKAGVQGIPCQDGLPMLIEQARLSQEFWWNRSHSYDDIRNYISPNLGRL